MQVADFVPKNINAAPVVYQGCTLKELMLISGIAFVINLLICVSVATFFDVPMVGLGAALMTTLATIWTVSRCMQILKRGRPPGYHLTKLRFLAHELKLNNVQYVKHTRTWQLGRSQYYGCKKSTAR